MIGFIYRFNILVSSLLTLAWLCDREFGLDHSLSSTLSWHGTQKKQVPRCFDSCWFSQPNHKASLGHTCYSCSVLCHDFGGHTFLIHTSLKNYRPSPSNCQTYRYIFFALKDGLHNHWSYYSCLARNPSFLGCIVPKMDPILIFFDLLTPKLMVSPLNAWCLH